jgi:hypothetical protein
LKAKETDLSIDEFDDRQYALDAQQADLLYTYVKYTNAYVYHLLRLQILDYFEYFAKIDTDMFIRGRLPANIVRMMRSGDKLLLTPYALVTDGLRGVEHVMDGYVQEERERCRNDTVRPASEEDSPLHWKRGSEWQTVYSNFMVGALSFYTAPEVLHLAEEYMAHSRVMLEERWVDQQWWTHPLAMMTTHPADRVLTLPHWTDSPTQSNFLSATQSAVLEHKPLDVFYGSKAGYWYTEGMSYSDSKHHREQMRERLQPEGDVLAAVLRYVWMCVTDGWVLFVLLVVLPTLVGASRSLGVARKREGERGDKREGELVKAVSGRNRVIPPPPPPPPPPPRPRVSTV